MVFPSHDGPPNTPHLQVSLTQNSPLIVQFTPLWHGSITTKSHFDNFWFMIYLIEYMQN